MFAGLSNQMENSLDGIWCHEVQLVSGDKLVTDVNELLKEICRRFEQMEFYLLVEEFSDVTCNSIGRGVCSSLEIFFKFFEFLLNFLHF